MKLENEIIGKFDDVVSKAFFEKRDGVNFLNVELRVANFDEVVEISKKISSFLDEIDHSDEEYFLDIYSKGTDYSIDLENVSRHINSSVQVSLIVPIKNMSDFTGELISFDDNNIVIKWNAKGQFRRQEILKTNIKKIKLFTKIGKA